MSWISQILNLCTDYTFQVVATGSALLGMLSGVLGSFAVLRKQSLLGDGISHAALPGVVLAFLLIGSKNTELLLLGGLVTGLLATACLMTIVKQSPIKFDSALALVLSVFFGLGMMLLTLSQKIPNANQAGLDRFLYGQASAMLERDVWMIVLCGLVLVGLVLLFWKEFQMLSFDPDFAHSIGIPVGTLQTLLTFLTVVVILLGLQTVGVILMSAMLIAPGVAARQWVKHLEGMILLSAVFGGLSGLVGTAVSSWVTAMPTGPVIVVCASLITGLSLLFAPGRGLVYQLYQRHQTKGTRITTGRDGK